MLKLVIFLDFFWDINLIQIQWNESGFRPLLCTYRLNWARRTSWRWWDEWYDTALQTQDSKVEPWRSEVAYATSWSTRVFYSLFYELICSLSLSFAFVSLFHSFQAEIFNTITNFKRRIVFISKCYILTYKTEIFCIINKDQIMLFNFQLSLS